MLNIYENHIITTDFSYPKFSQNELDTELSS